MCLVWYQKAHTQTQRQQKRRGLLLVTISQYPVVAYTHQRVQLFKLNHNPSMKKILIFCLLACLLQSVNVQGQASKYTTSIVTGSGAPVYTPSVSKKESTTYYDYSNKRLYGHNGTAWELLSIEFTNGVPSNGIDTKVKFVIDSLNNAVYTRKNGMFSAMVSVNIKKYTDGIASVNDTAKYAFQQIGKTYAYFDSTANSLIKIDRELTIRDFGAIEGTVGSGQRTINSTAIRNYISKLGCLKIPKGV